MKRYERRDNTLWKININNIHIYVKLLVNGIQTEGRGFEYKLAPLTFWFLCEIKLKTSAWMATGETVKSFTHSFT